METRTTIGQARGLGPMREQHYTKGGKDLVFYKRTLFLDNSPDKYGHQIKGKKDLMEAMDADFPEGTWVYVLEKKNGKFWNVESMRAANEEEVKAAEHERSLGSHKAGDTPSQLAPDRQIQTVRQNALRHADAWLATMKAEIKPEECEKEYFRFAEEAEAWVLREVGKRWGEEAKR